jgi:hypothetical protein
MRIGLITLLRIITPLNVFVIIGTCCTRRGAGQTPAGKDPDWGSEIRTAARSESQ